MAQVPLETLIRIEAGLKAELEVLRNASEVDLLDDLKEEYVFELKDAQLEELRKARLVLEEELLKAQYRNQQNTRHVRELRAEELSKLKVDDKEEEDEESLRKALYSLRRQTLIFAKEQWPLSQDEEQFEGGDFWDACVAACSDPSLAIEYSGREAAFAELLLQTGIVERAEDLAGMKRIRLVPEVYSLQEE